MLKTQLANVKPSVEGTKLRSYSTVQVPLPTVRLQSHPTHVLQCHLEHRRGDGVARQQQEGQIKDVTLIGTISIVTSQVKEMHTKSVYHTHSPHALYMTESSAASSPLLKTTCQDCV